MTSTSAVDCYCTGENFISWCNDETEAFLKKYDCKPRSAEEIIIMIDDYSAILVIVLDVMVKDDLFKDAISCRAAEVNAHRIEKRLLELLTHCAKIDDNLVDDICKNKSLLEKLMKQIYMLSYMKKTEIVACDFLQMCVTAHKRMNRQPAKFIGSTIVYFFYPLFHLKDSAFIYDPVVNQFGQLWSLLFVIPFMATRAVWFADLDRALDENGHRSAIIWLCDGMILLWCIGLFLKCTIEWFGYDYEFKIVTKSGQTVGIDPKVKRFMYLSEIWSKIDLILLTFTSVFVILDLLDVTENTAICCFAVSLIVLMFKTLDQIGNLLPSLGPFVDAFTNMFGDLVVFIVIVVILSCATAVALSPIFCREVNPEDIHPEPEHLQTSTIFGHDIENHVTYPQEGEEYFKVGYAACYEASFWFFFVKATGGESLEMLELLYLGNAHYGEEYFMANLNHFPKILRVFVVIIISMYEVMTAFCLLKGILLHSGIISKKAALNNTRFKKTKIYVDNIYNNHNAPIPWNCIYGLITLATCGKYPSRVVQTKSVDIRRETKGVTNLSNELNA